MADPKIDPLDVVAQIGIKLHANGAMSISGNIGDAQLAIQMIDAARDAVKNQLKRRDEIIVPNRDVVVKQHPDYPTLPLGDMKPEDRGDPASSSTRSGRTSLSAMTSARLGSTSARSMLS